MQTQSRKQRVDPQEIEALLQRRAQRIRTLDALEHYRPVAVQASMNRIDVDRRFEAAVGEGRR